jgi:hypothetical protein
VADRPRYDYTEGDTAGGRDREATTGTPRWVKVFGIIALVVVLLFVILALTKGPGGRGHGPDLHGLDGRTRPASVSADLTASGVPSVATSANGGHG